MLTCLLVSTPCLLVTTPPGTPFRPLQLPRRSSVPLCGDLSKLGFGGGGGSADVFGDDSALPISIPKPLGLTLQPFDEDLLDSGVIVASVAPGSNAERAGVIIGSSVESINGMDVSRASLSAVVEAIAAAPANRAVSIGFKSNRDAFTFGGFGFGSKASG